MKNPKIIIIRKKLDKLDNNLLKIIKKRMILVNQILKFKKHKNEIIDKKRIKIIMNTIRRKSLKSKIDPKITQKIWKSMIRSFINYEFRNFKKK
tara:strand:- start:331 stop:612 length:282 start_codon:yes stop_codon:yes gene_type:complete